MRKAVTRKPGRLRTLGDGVAAMPVARRAQVLRDAAIITRNYLRMQKLPRIEEVKAAKSGLVLEIVWQSGGVSKVNVETLVKTFQFYAPLRESRSLFQTARVGEYGICVVWDGGIDMAADTLWRLTQD